MKNYNYEELKYNYSKQYIPEEHIYTDENGEIYYCPPNLLELFFRLPEKKRTLKTFKRLATIKGKAIEKEEETGRYKFPIL